MNGYRLLTMDVNGVPTPGVLTGDRVHAVEDLLPGHRGPVVELLQDWDRTHEAIRSVLPVSTGGVPLAEVRLLAPILHPGAIFCAGANYWDHVEEMEGSADRTRRPRDPWFFVKTSAHSVVEDQATVRRPRGSEALDYEAELAVVIGRSARDVPAREALGVIAGYTIVNDLSARDLMKRPDRPPAMAYDWVGQKCFDGAAPLGPWITPAAYVPDCHDLAIRLSVNGTVKQSSTTANLIHDVYEQIAWLSHQLTLRPGDVIATGTPAGVGLPRQDYLRSGDVVRAEISGLGSLTTHIV
ncbi:fumarylacetoacetate hydrolase family protein [Streptomyces malaysiensis subsp. malaysiensis]|uniref:fumarylacetoacetate hydrolase family protein n=1 Tax=Streptomyces malaysiensis TaxID=92644 RepID=UPI0024C09663|nr:fumarylacetoacetate hydrolase family protein [Streptomyces sp. NA07423]WHX16070.1 fumarylacetoacetate hydrolase family protein [Streptomyces sp. NA07423]